MASWALLLLFSCGVANAVRTLKEGPLIDCEGREYKSLLCKRQPQFRQPQAQPRQAQSRPAVEVRCTETSMIVVVSAGLYGYGRLEAAAQLVLGGAGYSQDSRCRAVATEDNQYVIEVELQDCGSKLNMSEDSVIYSNNLVISSAPTPHGITRFTPTVVPVSCHYKRTHIVSSFPQRSSLTISSKPSAFSMKLMTDDWTSESPSRVFYLGDFLHLEASYTAPDSTQRRLFMDSCVATLTPDPTSVPRYYFIQNHGCLTDAKEGGSETWFLPRTRTYSLQLQLQTFLFHQDSRNSIFITCQLSADSELWQRSPINKACSYIRPSWKDVDGSDDLCQCCDHTCERSSPKWRNPRLPIPADTSVCGTVTLGPLTIMTRK